MFRWARFLLLGFMLAVVVGAVVVFMQRGQEKDEWSKGVETMTANIQIDPEIDLTSDQEISIIVIFKTKPARAAVELAKMKGVPLTLE